MFNSFKSFVPKISSLFVLTLMFWGGWILAFVLLIAIGLMWDGLTQYKSVELIIMYCLAFGVPMLYAFLKAKHNEKKEDCLQVVVDAPDYGKYGALIWWIGSITVGTMMVVLALWLCTFIPSNDTMGSYSALLDNLELSNLDIIIAEVIFAPIFTTWFICVACVRGLTAHGLSLPIALTASVIGMFLIDMDYTSLPYTIAQVICAGYVYKQTCSVKLAYVTILIMCCMECLNMITHFMI